MMSIKFYLAAIFLLITASGHGQPSYGFAEGVIVKKDSTVIKCFVEMQVTYESKVGYQLMKDGKEIYLKIGEIKSMTTPANHFLNISLGNEERLMAQAANGKIQLFQFVRINQGATNPNSNVSLYLEPTIIYALIKDGTTHEINSKNFRTDLSPLLIEQPHLQTQLVDKKFKLSQVGELVNEFNRLEARKKLITARILDSSTKKPIQDAKVTISRNALETATNALGYFQLTIDIEDTLVVVHPLYVPSRFRVPDQSRFQIALTPLSDN